MGATGRKLPASYPGAKRGRVRKDPPRKYPFLFGCYIDDEFERVYARRRIQGQVEVYHYKGHMMLSVQGGPHADRAVWLDGEDIEEVIKLLREARVAWLKAYRSAERVLIKRGDLKRPSKKRSRRR